MWDILSQAFGFVAIIILGYALKKIGFFKEEDFTVLSKITIRITLPGAIITSFSEQSFDPALLSCAVGAGWRHCLYHHRLPYEPEKNQRAEGL